MAPRDEPVLSISAIVIAIVVADATSSFSLSTRASFRPTMAIIDGRMNPGNSWWEGRNPIFLILYTDFDADIFGYSFESITEQYFQNNNNR